MPRQEFGFCAASLPCEHPFTASGHPVRERASGLWCRESAVAMRRLPKHVASPMLSSGPGWTVEPNEKTSQGVTEAFLAEWRTLDVRVSAFGGRQAQGRESRRKECRSGRIQFMEIRAPLRGLYWLLEAYPIGVAGRRRSQEGAR